MTARRHLSVALQPGTRTLVTGASGFIGSAITRALLDRGVEVTAAVEPGGDTANLEGCDVARVTLDVRDRDGVHRAVAGHQVVFHTAALYRFWAPDPRAFYDVNVQGTRHVVEAATSAGCEAVVYTSTVGTIGIDAATRGLPADETRFPRVDHLFGLYKQSKYVAEHEVLRAAAEGAPVTLVHPTFPLGPRDRRPTPTGKLVVDFLNGRMPGFVDTSLNVAHVDDLAACHLLAAERGVVGRSYIAGGENMSMRRLLETLAACCGLAAPTRHLPGFLGVGAAALSQLVEGRLLGREPTVPLEAARMSTTHMAFDDTRARTELGYDPRPAAEAVADSARWYAENGYVKAARLARITWDDSSRLPTSGS